MAVKALAHGLGCFKLLFKTNFVGIWASCVNFIITYGTNLKPIFFFYQLKLGRMKRI